MTEPWTLTGQGDPPAARACPHLVPTLLPAVGQQPAGNKAQAHRPLLRWVTGELQGHRAHEESVGNPRAKHPHENDGRSGRDGMGGGSRGSRGPRESSPRADRAGSSAPAPVTAVTRLRAGLPPLLWPCEHPCGFSLCLSGAPFVAGSLVGSISRARLYALGRGHGGSGRPGRP